MKNLLFAILLFLPATYQSCTSADATKPSEPQKETIETVSKKDADVLSELGFSGVESVNASYAVGMRKEIMDTYGLNFISVEEMDKMTSLNGLIWSQAINYRGEIPANIKKQIIVSYDKVKDYKHYKLTSLGWKDLDWAGEDDKGVFVVGPPEYFTKDAKLHEGKDPIIVIRIDGGWIELARW